MRGVYLDHNATTPLDARVLETMLPYFKERFGNASSVHARGRAVRAALDEARAQVAALVNAQPTQVIFTSGGTEANNLALKGSAVERVGVSAIEHASLMGPAVALMAQGRAVTYISVDESGRVTVPLLRQALRESNAQWVGVMLANNETGVIQDIAALSAVTRAFEALLHTDATQAAGKIAVDFPATGAQSMALSAHKLNGPQGVGALVIDKRVEMAPLLHGGGHEQGLRAGTENVAGIVGFGKAAELAREELAARQKHTSALRTRLEARLGEIPGVTILAREAARLPNTVMITVPDIEGETLLLKLDAHGVAVSSGSACASGKGAPSHVLLAMGVPENQARCAIRLSVGMSNSTEDIDQLIAALRSELQG